MQDTFMSKSRFTKMIEQCVIEKRMSHLDAVVYLCEKNNIDVEDAKKYISNPIKNKLEAEAISLHYLEADSSVKLPV